MHAFYRQTDGRTEFSSLDRVCILCSVVKMRFDILNVYAWITSETDRQTNRRIDGQVAVSNSAV